MFSGARVAPLASYSSVSLSPPAAVAVTTPTFENPTVNDLLDLPEVVQLQHYASQLRPHLQWTDAAEVMASVVRNSLFCVVCIGVATACHYSGNIFSLKSSMDQSLPELLMATLIWGAVVHCSVTLIAHVPMLVNQRFLTHPGKQSTFWFCTKKLLKDMSPYFAIYLATRVSVGLIVQNTSLMHARFRYKLHFYLGALCSNTLAAGVAYVSRKIYYEETCEGRNRSRAPKSSLTKDPLAEYAPSDFVNKLYERKVYLSRGSRKISSHADLGRSVKTRSFWRTFLTRIPNTLFVASAGAYVHIVSCYRIMNKNTSTIMLFAIAGILIKFALQELTRKYILKQGIRKLHAMCVLVGVPTVLIDTQSRIVLIGTQTNSFLVVGTFGMAIAEIFLRAGKAALVMWTINHKRKAVQHKMMEVHLAEQQSIGPSPPPPELPTLSSLRQEFFLWKRQVLSYHTAELTADMYAEYIAITCSQSIIFWYVGHPHFPALHLPAITNLSPGEMQKWRANQMLLLGFQFVVEIFVDYICVVMEMAAGIDFERIKQLSTFLAVLFMTVAVVNISISATVYLN